MANGVMSVSRSQTSPLTSCDMGWLENFFDRRSPRSRIKEGRRYNNNFTNKLGGSPDHGSSSRSCRCGSKGDRVENGTKTDRNMRYRFRFLLCRRNRKQNE